MSKKEDKGERLAGGTIFGGFRYTDTSGTITKVKYQYKVNTSWLPATPIELAVSNGGAANTPSNVQNVSQTQMWVYQGPTPSNPNGGYGPVVSGNECDYTSSAAGNTDSTGASTLTDS